MINILINGFDVVYLFIPNNKSTLILFNFIVFPVRLFYPSPFYILNKLYKGIIKFVKLETLVSYIPN